MMKRWIEITAVFTLAALMTGGCKQAKYEYITVENIKGTSPDIEIGETSSNRDTIVLGSEGETQRDETGQIDPQEDNGQAVLLFGGDVLLSNHVLNAYRKSGNIGGVVDSGYLQVMEAADFFMVNQEFPFSNRGTAAEDKQYTFRLPPESVSMFAKMGIDGVTLANNHALDYGRDALLDSCDTLDGAGILHTGAGANLEAAKKPVVVERKGLSIGILGATRVIPEVGWAAGKNHAGMLATYDAAIALEEIRRMRTVHDYVMVYVHWGIERDEMPQDYQRKLGQQYIDAGADLVIGSHPHVLQGIEYYKGKPIVYSLGNFVFGSSIPKTVLLQVELPAKASLPEGIQSRDGSAQEGAADVKLRLIPGTSGAGYTRMLEDEEKLAEFYRYIERISFGITCDEQGYIIPGW